MKMGARERLAAEAEKARKALESGEVPTEESEETPPAPAEPPAPATPPEPAPPAAPTPAPSSDASQAEITALKADVARLTAALESENEPTWKQRYSSLQGMFNHQGEELKSIKAEIAELKAKPATPPEPPKPAAPEEDPEYNDLVQEVGEKAAKILWKQREDHKKEVETLRSTFKGDLEAVKGDAKSATERAAAVGQASAYERFYGGLSDSARKYTEAGTDGYLKDQDFAKYLSEKVPGTPYTRAQAYGEFAKGMDATGINELVAEFEKSTGKAAPAAPAAEPPKTPSERAAEFVEPGKTASGKEEPNDKPEMIKESEIDAFHDSVKRKTFKGTSTEMAALMTKYRNAGMEGRVLFGQ